MGENTSHTSGKLNSDLILLGWRERIDDTVDSLGGIVCMKSGKNKRGDY